MGKDKKDRGVKNVNKAPKKPVYECTCGYTTDDFRKMIEHDRKCKFDPDYE